METVLQAKNMTKIYGMGSKQPFTALENIDLEIKTGEFIVVMGPSGSGKSTLVNNISTIDIPTNGSLYILNQEVKQMSENQLGKFRYQYLGFIFQKKLKKIEKMAKKDLKSAKIFKKSRFQVYLPCIKLIQRAKAIHINRISLFTNSSRIIFHTIIFTIYVNVLTIKTNSSRTHIRFFMSFTKQFRLHRMKHKYLIMMQIYRFYGKLHN